MKRRTHLPVADRALIGMLLAVVAAGASGCGSVVSESGAEDGIEAELESSLNIEIQSVDCPPDEPVEAGSRFRCDVKTADGKTVVATVETLNGQADLEIKAVAGPG